MCYLAEIAGLGKPTVHMILKSDLKMSKASARWVPRLSEDECGHLAQLVTIVKVSDAINNLNDVRQWVRPGKLVKLVHKHHYLIFCLQNLNDNAEIIEAFTSKI